MIGSPNGEPQGQDLAWLHALARRIALSEADADDLVQETWMSAAQSHTRDPGSVRRWLAGILRNRERMQRRAEGRRRRREAEAVAQEAAAQEAELEVHRARVLATLREALHELDEDDRGLLLARYCDEHSAPELADRLGIPTSTVRSRLSRAAARLRDSLDERWGGERRAWAPAVLAPLPLRPTGISTVPPVAAGSAAMLSMKLMKFFVAAVLATGGVVAWKAAHPSESPISEPEVDADAELAARLHDERSTSSATSHVDVGGLVLDAETRAPIAGAVVMLATPSGAPGIVRAGDVPSVPHARTGADGRFVFEKLAAGDYHVTASAPGYLPAATRSSDDGGEPTLLLARGGNVVEGVVEDIVGGVVEGAIVVARRGDDLPLGAQRAGWAAITDENGAYALSLPDGAWTIEAGGDDYSHEKDRVTLAKGPAHVDFRLVPAATIRGRVVERAGGAPVAGAVVGFNSIIANGEQTSFERSDERTVATTDADGRFVLRPLEPGSYSLYASASRLASEVETVVPVEIGDHVDGVEVVVDPAFDVSGFVVAEDDRTQGIGGVAIGVMGNRARRSWFVTTEADGHFELRGVTPGVHMMMLDGEGLVPSVSEHSLRVEEKDAQDHIIALSRGTKVSGRISPAVPALVRVENRAKSGGFEVMIAGAKLKRAQARVADDGTFTIEGVAPGEWKVVAYGDDGSTGSFDVEVGSEPIADVAVELAERASVRGSVHDESGAPLPGLRVEVFDERMDVPPPFRRQVLTQATTDAKGSFAIVGVDPGDHGLAIVDALGNPLTTLAGPQRVACERAAIAVELRTRLPDGRIEGVVVDDEGSPVADAWVVAQTKDERPSASGHPVLTDDEGRFVIARLADQRYVVHARGPAEAGRGVQEDVAIGSRLQIQLAALGDVHGHVRMSGAAVTRFAVDTGRIADVREFISADGSFAIPRLRPGKHHFTITSEQGSAGVDVVVERGRDHDVDVELVGWSTVTGVLVSAVDRTPLSGISIDVDSDGGVRKDPREGSIFGGGGHESGSDGRFEISGVGGGKAELRMSKGGRMMGESLGSHEVAVTAGETIDVGEVLVLPPVDVPHGERGWLGFMTARDSFAVETVPIDNPSGLRIGDRVVAVDGIRGALVGDDTLRDAMRTDRLRVGSSHTITVVRGDEELELSLTVVPRPD